MNAPAKPHVHRDQTLVAPPANPSRHAANSQGESKKLLDIETHVRGGDNPPIPHVRTGTYRAGRTKVIKTILLTEDQYHVLFPEYFITVGLINEKVSTASQLSGTQMKSGDEVTNIVDSYTGENKYL